MAAARGAAVGELVGLCVVGPLLANDADDLRDDITGAAQDHEIADADILALDLVLVVEGGIRDDDAADGDGFEARRRGQGTRAADLDVDVFQTRRGFLRGKFVRDGPARGARDEAEALLQVEAVDLVDHAVDVVAEARPVEADLVVVGEDLVDIPADLHQRVRGDAPAGECVHDAGLRFGRQGTGGPPGVAEEAQGTLRRDRRIELAQRACGGVARVREDLGAGRRLFGVEALEVLVPEIDFAADLDEVRHAAAFQAMRDFLDGAHVGGDVFAFLAVAARGGLDQGAVLVGDRYGEAIDLGFRRHFERGLACEAQKAANALQEFRDVLVREGVA